jgi:hypothetical protein
VLVSRSQQKSNSRLAVKKITNDISKALCPLLLPYLLDENHEFVHSRLSISPLPSGHLDIYSCIYQKQVHLMESRVGVT